MDYLRKEILLFSFAIAVGTVDPLFIDPEKWLSTQTKAALAGDAGAQRDLFMARDSTNGVSKDEKKALEFGLMLAKNGDPPAMCNISVLYLHGSVVRDEKEGVRWMQRAADSGLAQAQFNIGTYGADWFGSVWIVTPL
jgi:TPR repeat protein